MTTKESLSVGFLSFLSMIFILIVVRIPGGGVTKDEMAIAKFERVDRIGYGQIVSGIEKLPNKTYRAIVKVDDQIYSCIVRESAKEGHWAKVSKVTFSRGGRDNSDCPLFFATPVYTNSLSAGGSK